MESSSAPVPSPQDGVNREVDRYKKWLKDRVDRGYYVASSKDRIAGTLADENVWGIRAGAPITQAVLDDAGVRQREILSYFRESGIPAWEKYRRKTFEQVKHGRGFNAYRDAITIRVPYHKMPEAPFLLRKVKDLIEANEGSIYVHYERDPDIIQYINWYHPGSGHTIQVLIMHLFAAMTLERDYLLKSERPCLGIAPKHIDLWDEGLYMNIRDALLNREQWEKAWHKNPQELWLGPLDRLIQRRHGVSPPENWTVERRQDERLKAELHDTLRNSFAETTAFNVNSIAEPVQNQPPTIIKSTPPTKDERPE
ncbi:MAG: hypothetical protein Q9165_007928 [Trypethelium subeluteriae]